MTSLAIGVVGELRRRGAFRRWSALRRCMGAVALLALATLLSCDGYLRSVCDRESLPGCEPSPVPDLAARRPSPTGTPRAFEWRASLARESRALAGLAGRRLQLVESELKSDTTIKIQELRVDLENVNIEDRIIEEKSISFRISGLNLYRTLLKKSVSQFYVHGRLFGVLGIDAASDTYWRLKADCQPNPTNPHSFAHQQIDALAVYCDDGQVLGFVAGSHIASSTVGSRVDAAVLADWQDLPSGPSLLVFRGSSIELTSLAGADRLRLLQSQLSAAVFDRKTGSGPVTAAYVMDIDRDGHPELVFARDDGVWAVTYRGQEWLAEGTAFALWPRSLTQAPIPGNERPRSLLLADLDDDWFPDLLIETDQQLHFYRNIPGPG